MAGSSPHTRDKSREFAESQKALGIIPAYAGQMQDYILQLPLAQDHPRIRGTNTIYELTEDYLRGSSPHTRDKCRFSASSIACFRIIPAYAGQIGVYLGFSFYNGDHPRIRGTNNCLMACFLITSGSSPHTRDKCLYRRFTRCFCRIIPAYAGQMKNKVLLAVGHRDHPRIRGTNSTLFLQKSAE